MKTDCHRVVGTKFMVQVMRIVRFVEFLQGRTKVLAHTNVRTPYVCGRPHILDLEV